MGWSEQPPQALQLDGSTLTDFLRRPNPVTFSDAGNLHTTLYDGATNSLAAAMAYHPSLGGNYTYVGGNWHRGSFQTWSSYSGTTTPRWVVGKIHEAQKPDMLMMFCSSRGVDVKTSTWGSFNWGRDPIPYSAGTPIVPGFWEVVPPRSGYPSNSTTITWVTSNSFNA